MEVVLKLTAYLLVITILLQTCCCAEYGYYSSTELGEQPSWFAPPSGHKNNFHSRFENRQQGNRRRSTTRRSDIDMPWKSGDRVNLAGIPALMKPKYRPSTTADLVSTECPCNSTPEYNPICASNNQTFSNPGRLQCAQQCGQQLTLKHYGVCRV